MTAVVCDASVLVKLLVPEPETERAWALVEAYRVIVPEFAFLEVGNVLWFRVQERKDVPDQALDHLERLRAFGFDVRSVEPLVPRALTMACSLAHPIYDCLYLALAETVGVSLITADRRFLAALRRTAMETVKAQALADFA
jgi:predicted nucleic acid-binding protein